MPPFNPNESHLLFEAVALAPDAFNVVAFRGEEAISRPFRYELDLIADDPDIKAEDVVGKKGTFTALGRKVHGIVSEFEYLGFTTRNHGYRAVLVPQLWILSLRFDSQIFFDLSPPELIESVMAEEGIAAEFEISGSYPTREFYTQYKETDLAFVSRIAEHFGISFRFKHDGGSDVVVFFDDSTQAPPMGDESTLRFEPDASLADPAPNVTEFTERARLITGQVLVKDYNYRDPETALLSQSTVDANAPGLYYEYGTHHKNQSEGDLFAKVRKEELEAGRRVFRGTSNRAEVQAGYTLTLYNHFRERMNADYLITEVRMKGDHRYYLGHVEQLEEPVYENEFVCIPAAVPFRPRRATPVPTVPGLMTARIETAGGDYAHLDEEGRYRAKMHFDLSDRTGGEATRPLRMNQPYSGPGYGIHFPNHPDTEVIWACVNGDPDRPLAIGTSPNPSNASPVTSANKAQNVIRTMGQNELTFDDTIGDENIYVHATKNNHIDIVNDQEVDIGANQSISVGGNRTKEVGGNQSESVSGSKSISVARDHTESVDGEVTISFAKSASLTVGKDRTTTVGAEESVSIGASRTSSVGANASSTVGKNLTVRAGDDGALTFGKKLSVQSGQDMMVVSGKKLTIQAADQITIKVGSASITMKKNGDIKLEGKNIDVKGSSNVTLKGSKINAN